MWAVFNITNRCNFKCATCLRGYPGSFKDMTLETASKVVAGLKRFGWTGISLTGGEPIMHPQFEEMVDLIVTGGYMTSVVSNGWYAEKYRPVLNHYKAAVGFVCISVDGVNPETHESVRGVPGSHERAVEAVKMFKADGFNTKVAICINKRNFGELREYIERFRPLVDNVNIINTIPCEHNGDIVLSDEEMAGVHKLLREIGFDRVHTTTSMGMSSGVNFCADMGMGALTINYNGDVVFCCDTPYDGAVLGNVRDGDLAAALKLYAKTAARLLEIRIDTLAGGEIPPGFNTCLFCHHHLRDIIVHGPERKLKPLPAGRLLRVVDDEE